MGSGWDLPAVKTTESDLERGASIVVVVLRKSDI